MKEKSKSFLAVVKILGQIADLDAKKLRAEQGAEQCRADVERLLTDGGDGTEQEAQTLATLRARIELAPAVGRKVDEAKQVLHAELRELVNAPRVQLETEAREIIEPRRTAKLAEIKRALSPVLERPEAKEEIALQIFNLSKFGAAINRLALILSSLPVGSPEEVSSNLIAAHNEVADFEQKYPV